MSIKNLSVFFPAYNEEGSIENTVLKARQVLEKLNLKYEIIIVDDGSTDQTAKIAENLARQNQNIRVIHHSKNLGYGEALKSGFYNAKYDTICYTDGDGQFDFSEVNKFLEKSDRHDLVIGYRIKRRDPLFRIFFKKGWKLSLFAFFGLTLKDVDCGFKMIKKKVLEKIPRLESSRGAMINAELAIKAKKYGFKVAEVGVNHYPRLSGKPTGASFRVILKSYLDLLKLWWKLKDQKILFIFLVATLFLAAFLRLYNIEGYMIFLGDQGRDALIMKKILALDLPLIGPPTSVGNIYLGPLYYYMMFIPMVLTGLNPVSASVMNALAGIATILLIYYVGKVWFSRISGLLAAFLYAISPVTINYSRFSWNPNPLPFFALAAIFSFYKARVSGNYKWFILTGLSAAAAAQMHYLALILLPILGVLWMKELLEKKARSFWTGTILGILSFFILMSPLLIFDLKHNFLNYRAFSAFFSEGSSVSINIFSNLVRLPQIYSHNLMGRYMAGENYILQIILSILIIAPLLFRRNWQILILGIWLLLGLAGVSFYQQEIYDHYLGFLNPVPYLLLGSVFSVIRKKILIITFIIIIIFITIINLQKNPLLSPPQNQLQRTKDVAEFVIEQAGGKPFNFALLADQNYDSAYQFYLEEFRAKPKKLPFEKTDQLFVVCENPCDPIYSSKYEIAAFGWTLVDREWDFVGLKIYKLVQNPEGNR